jgi:O-antigen/teichoic acid export membrane protein
MFGMKGGSLKVNFIMNMMLTMSSYIFFPLITFPYISRILLPAGMGKISFATSFISYFVMVSELGIPTYGIRACARVRDDKEELTRVVHELLMINLFMCVLSYVALGIALKYIPRLQGDRELYVIISFTIVLNAIGMEWLYKALEQYTYITIRSVIFKLIAIIAMFLLIHKQQDYVMYGAISIFAGSASNILNFINVRKYISMKWMGKYCLKRHFKPVLTFFAIACAGTIYTSLDNVMLGFMTMDTEVGYYNVAIKIKSILASLVTSLGSVLLPRASYYVENGMMDDLKKITGKALNFVFLMASPLVVYFMAFAKESIFFLSGSAYESAVMPLIIIMPTVLFIGITNLLGIQMLVPLGRENILLHSVITGAVLDFIINAICIPRFASAGAAIGTLVAEFAVLVVQYRCLKQEIRKALISVHYQRICAAIIAGLLFSVWTKYLRVHTFVILVISAVLFFAGYAMFLLFTKEPLVVEIKNDVARKMREWM